MEKWYKKLIIMKKIILTCDICGTGDDVKSYTYSENLMFFTKDMCFKCLQKFIIKNHSCVKDLSEVKKDVNHQRKMIFG